jgi:hypothetical protein
MNLVTPMQRWQTPFNRLVFRALETPFLSFSLRGLLTLSMIHYARWVFVRAQDWPRLSDEQPREDTGYDYMLFFSNFNGSWAQYVDSFSSAIPSGLNLLWYKNVGWPKSSPQDPFHRYVLHNQFWTNHYYSAYPLAASNDVKAASRVRKRLVDFVRQLRRGSPEQFKLRFQRMLRELQGDLSLMDATPPVSTASENVDQRLVREARRSAVGHGRALV